MFTNNVPKFYWGEAVLTATYLINRMPSRILSFRSPIDILQESYPFTNVISVLPANIFGSVAYVYLAPHMRSKKVEL